MYINCVLSQAQREVLTAGTSFTFALIHHRRSSWHQVSGWLRSTQTTHIYQKTHNVLERSRTRGSISVGRSNQSIDRNRIDRLNRFEYRIVSKSITIGSIDRFRDRDRWIDRSDRDDRRSDDRPEIWSYRSNRRSRSESIVFWKTVVLVMARPTVISV